MHRRVESHPDADHAPIWSSNAYKFVNAIETQPRDGSGMSCQAKSLCLETRSRAGRWSLLSTAQHLFRKWDWGIAERSPTQQKQAPPTSTCVHEQHVAPVGGVGAVVAREVGSARLEEVRPEPPDERLERHGDEQRQRRAVHEHARLTWRGRNVNKVSFTISELLQKLPIT